MRGALIALIILYGLLSLWVYQGTPMGQVALLDARENIATAYRLHLGSDETAYRALLYPAFLSLFIPAGGALLPLGQLFNLAFHFLATTCVGLAAYRIFPKRAGALLAAGLYGFNPVALYLSFDLLDTTFVQALAAAGFYFLSTFLRPKADEDPSRGLFLAGVFFAFAALGRSHFFVWALLPLLVALGNFPRASCSPIKAPLAALAGIALPLLVFLAAESIRTPTPRLLPLQGAYNLYAANADGASGEFYAQKVEFIDLPEGFNTARAEAELLYRRASGNWQTSLSEEALNSFYLKRFTEELCANPAQKLTLYIKKFVSFFHNHEGYNNKTFSFQKSLHPLLRFNPLGFTLIATLAFFTLLFFKPLPKGALSLLAFIFIYALAASLFYASDRFRLPLLIPISILCAGAPAAYLAFCARAKTSQGLSQKLSASLPLAALALYIPLSTLPILGIGTHPTQGADELLLSQAAVAAGNDLEAVHWASRARSSQPLSQNATETLLRAHYNLLLKGEIPTPSAEWFAEQLAAARSLKNPSDDLSYLLGYFEWMLEGKRDAWHNLVANNSPTQTTHSLAALCYTGGLFPHELLLIEALPMEERPIAILVALSALGDKSAAPALRGKIGPQAAQETVSAYRKLFDRAGFPALNKPHAR